LFIAIRQRLSISILLMCNAPGGLQPGRFFAYCGIALYESVLPGMPAYQTLSEQLTDMPAMPSKRDGAAAANAALAAMNRDFFP